MQLDFAGTSICTGVGTDSPSKFSYEGERGEQVRKFLRAPQSVVADRLNEYSVFDFTLFKPQSSIQEAEYFTVWYRQNLIAQLGGSLSGTLKITTNDGSGSGQKVLYLTNALLKKCKARYDGCNCWVDFVFTGGMPTTVKPT